MTETEYYEAPQEQGVTASQMAEIMGGPRSETVVQSNPDFMSFLFKFKKEVSMPLRRLWRGEELNENGQWDKAPEEGLRIMNEKGVSWGISLIESYINSVYVVSNYDELKSYFAGSKWITYFNC